MPKRRTSIPDDVAARVLFEQDHTCCICRESGLPVQIHHLDEDPSNNAFENLALLCLEDHDRTQVRGGFARKLAASEVENYRVDWLARVESRRAQADQLAVEKMSAKARRAFGRRSIAGGETYTQPSEEEAAAYLQSLPALRKAAIYSAHKLWDTGVTSKMMLGTQSVITVYEDMLTRLASLYPERHFGEVSSAIYFSDRIAEMYEWAYAVYQPSGSQQAGSLSRVLAGAAVIDGLSAMIELMVDGIYSSCFSGLSEFDPREWREDWKGSDSSSHSG